ncbi:hypothetical protein BCR35DRAFT_312978 [Leucosporidium creatinivorum]|uniref:DNA repair metallo-beta-lactamase domain-containing protein n=1 Tax=Leucosporidium creatinivorum TaxID=106004 RepID=A0A1Y2FW43_9BASI|nr:hypothetical protein BCR35DRAFT_312978 [Leucosporidium creatinivorum]
MSTHHGFIKEFPWIRVDAFNGGDDPGRLNPFTGKAPFVHLLTHAHTDHIQGLDSPNFQGRIYTTAVTKHLLLNTMEAGERVRHEELPHARKVLKFANLRKRSLKGKGGSAMDLVREIPLDTPQLIEGPDNASVLVTAIDANHCPGACMFLIEGAVNGVERAVIVTGDIRAEDWWIASLKRHPALSKYLAWDGPRVASSSKDVKGKGKARMQDSLPCLDNIYLDTSCVLVDEELVSKEEAVHSLVHFISQFPPQTRFFLNAWTWGYEEMLKGVYRAFGERIHLDRYKMKAYSSPPAYIPPFDPLLASLGTTSTATPHRFHACERRWKCDQCWGNGTGCYVWDPEYLPMLEGPKQLKQPGRRAAQGEVEGAAPEEDIVYVNPAEMPRWKWEQYKARLEETLELAKAREERGEAAGSCESSVDEASKRPNFLVRAFALLQMLRIVPLARHSTLPELQRFVALFKPRTLYPLTIIDSKSNPCRDYLAMPTLFADCLAPGGVEQLAKEAREHRDHVFATRRMSRRTQLDSSADDPPDHLALFLNHQLDKSRLNVEGGEEIAELVEVWSRPRKDEELPPLSPTKGGSPLKLHRPPSPEEDVDMSRAIVQEEEIVIEAQEQQEERPPKPIGGRIQETSFSNAPPFLPLSEEMRNRLLSYGDSQSQDPPSKSNRLHPLASSSTPLLPSPAFQEHPTPPPSSTEPHRKRRRVTPQVLAPDSTAPDPSPLDPPPPPATKATTHVDPIPSSRLPTTNSPFAPHAPPAPTPSSRPVARPSRKTHAARQRVLSILYRKIGGLRGPGGAIIPFVPDDPRRLGILPTKGERKQATPKHESFKTVSASVSPADGAGGRGRETWES